MNFATWLMQQFAALGTPFPHRSLGAWIYSTVSVPDSYVAVAVLVMFLAGLGILSIRLIKLHKKRSQGLPRKAHIRQIRRRFRGAA